MLSKQKTLNAVVQFEGIGVHCGKQGTLTLHPAGVNTGIVLQSASDPSKKIEIGKVVPLNAMHATVINNGNGWAISTIEHVMAAIAVLGLDNVVIEVEGTEFPIMDGSSLPFVEKIKEIGLKELDAPKNYITPIEPITFKDEEHSRTIEIIPAKDENDKGLYFEYEADFDNPYIPASSIHCRLSEDIFIKDIAPARTFGILEQLPFLKKNGLAHGASLDNTVVINKDGFVNERRFNDECVRHKLLDLIGDLALLGNQLAGTVKARRTGHSFNRLVVDHYINNPDKWQVI